MTISTWSNGIPQTDATGIKYLGIDAGGWENTADNITSITVGGWDSDALGVGSRIELWARKDIS